MMREELSEKVETVFAEEYGFPLGLAVLLLVLEALLPEAPATSRVRGSASGKPEEKSRGKTKGVPARA